MTCDNCGRERLTEVVTVSRGGDMFILNLCDECVKPIAELVAKVTPGPRKNKPSKPAGHRVIPID